MPTRVWFPLALVALAAAAGCLGTEPPDSPDEAVVEVPLPRLGASVAYNDTPRTIIYANASGPSFQLDLPRTERVVTADGRWVTGVWVQLHGEPVPHDNGPGWVYVVADATNRLVQWRNYCVMSTPDGQRCAERTTVLWNPGRAWLLGASPFMGETLTVGDRPTPVFPYPNGTTVERPYEVRPGPDPDTVRVTPVGNPTPPPFEKGSFLQGFWNASYVFDETSPFPRRIEAPPSSFGPRADETQVWTRENASTGDGHLLFDHSFWPKPSAGTLSETGLHDLPRERWHDRGPPTAGEVPRNFTLPEARGVAEGNDSGLQAFLEEHPEAVLVHGHTYKSANWSTLPRQAPGSGSFQSQEWTWRLAYGALAAGDGYEVEVTKERDSDGTSYEVTHSNETALNERARPANASSIPRQQVPLDAGVRSVRTLLDGKATGPGAGFSLFSPHGQKWERPRYVYQVTIEPGDQPLQLLWHVTLNARDGRLERAYLGWNATEWV